MLLLHKANIKPYTIDDVVGVNRMETRVRLRGSLGDAALLIALVDPDAHYRGLKTTG